MFQHVSRCSLDLSSTSRLTAHWRQIRNASAVLLQREIPEYINEAQLIPVQAAKKQTLMCMGSNMFGVT